MAAPKVGNVAEAVKADAKKHGAIGKTIAVRATQRGFYGRPLADLREPGQEFAFAVKDLEPVSAARDAVFQAAQGRLPAIVTLGGQKYYLPGWVEDAGTPPARPAADDEPSADGDDGEDVI